MTDQPDFYAMTDEQLCVLFRDSISDMDLRKQIYPVFLKEFDKGSSREAKLLVMREYLLKVKEHSTRVTKKVTPISENENVDSESSIQRESSCPSPSSLHQKGNTDFQNNMVSLSVWEKLHRHTPDVSDPEQTSRLAYYSKYQQVIKEVIDKFQILTASDGETKANEIKIRVSRKPLEKLLNDLYTDGFLELEVIPCGMRNPAYVFSTERCSKERFTRYTKKFRESEEKKNGVTKKVISPKRSHDKKGNTVDEEQLEIIKENAKLSALAQKEGFAEARKIEQEEMQKVAEIKTEEHRVKKELERKQSREEEKIIRHPDLNPEFAGKYVDGMAEFKRIYFEECKTKTEQQAQQNYSQAIESLRTDLIKQQAQEKERADAQPNGSETE